MNPESSPSPVTVEKEAILNNAVDQIKHGHKTPIRYEFTRAIIEHAIRLALEEKDAVSATTVQGLMELPRALRELIESKSWDRDDLYDTSEHQIAFWHNEALGELALFMWEAFQSVESAVRVGLRVEEALRIQLKQRAAPSNPKCQDCGIPLNEGEAKTFTVCDDCWQESFPAPVASVEQAANVGGGVAGSPLLEAPTPSAPSVEHTKEGREPCGNPDLVECYYCLNCGHLSFDSPHDYKADLELKEAASDNVKATGQNELPGLSLIAAERQRQVTKEGWTPEHDDQHDSGELAVAGMCYAAYAGNLLHPNTQGDGDWRTTSPEWWPWDEEWWKPTDEPLGSLVKAGALIAAEIDRLLRLNPDCAPSVGLETKSDGATGASSPNPSASVEHVEQEEEEALGEKET